MKNFYADRDIIATYVDSGRLHSSWRRHESNGYHHQCPWCDGFFF